MTTTDAAAPEIPDFARTTYGEQGYRHRWLVLAVVLIADVMDLLDATVANIAGPSIRSDIGGSDTTLQWILAAYTLTFAVGLITSGRAGDLFGRRRMFLVGMVGFTVASFLCGVAPSAGLLIAARVAQGLFGAVMIPQGFAMVKASFTNGDLQKAFIPFGPVMGLSAVLGPILAGVLIDADLFGSGWRMIFWINLPVGAVAAYLAWRYLPLAETRDHEARLDPVGSVLVTVASALLIYPLVQGHDLGWPTWIWAMFVGSAVLWILFAVSERRSDHPVIEPSLFTHREFIAGLVFLGTFFTAMMGFFLCGNLFMQLGLHFTPMHTGLALAPWALGTAIGAAASGAALAPKLGRHLLHIGLLVVIVGLLAMWWTVGHNGMHTTGWDLAPSFLVTGFGSGLVFPPLFDIILAKLGHSEVGTGSGLLNAVQQFSGALGVAILGTLFFELLKSHDFAHSLQTVLLASLGCYVVAFLAAFLLPMQAREDSAH